MNKRRYEEVFESSGMLDVLGNTAFKMMALSNGNMANLGSCKSQYLNAHISDYQDPSKLYHFSMEELASLTDIEVLDAARHINSEPIIEPAQTAYLADPSELRRRDIKKISIRRGGRTVKPTLEVPVPADQVRSEMLLDQEQPLSHRSSISQSDSQAEQPGPDVRSFPQEMIKVDYLEQMVTQCNLPITPEQANKMTEFTDQLTAIIQQRQLALVNKVTGESALLKKAYKIQANVLDQLRGRRKDLEDRNVAARDELARLSQEILAMEEFLGSEADSLY